MIKDKFKKIIFSLAALLLAPFVASAQISTDGPSIEFENPIDAKNIQEIVLALLSFVVKIGTVIAVFAIIYSGFLFVTAQGSDDKLKKAKSVFFWTVIGAMILIGAQMLGEIVCNTAKELGADVQCRGASAELRAGSNR